MIFVYIGVPFIVLLIVGYLYNKQKDDKLKKQIHALLNQYGVLQHHQYEIKNQTFDIHYFKVGVNEELVINSPIVWEIHGGTGSRLIDQKHLKDHREKLIIVYPSKQPIKRFINEHEMVFVNHASHFNHMHVVKLDELELFLKEAI